MNQFYVYMLIDPRTHEPFYIGKGSGDRVSFHIRESNHSQTSNPLKTNVIKRIQDLGLQVGTKIVQESMAETEAFNLERALIAQYGRRNMGTGCLTNMSDGGEGNSGRAYNPEQASKISAALTGRKRPDVAERNKLKNQQMWEERRKSGWSHSEETRKLLSEQSSSRKHTIETKAKISDANSRRVVSSETKAKISAARSAMKGTQTRSEETKEKMRQAWIRRKLES